jgi:hypothetical protein
MAPLRFAPDPRFFATWVSIFALALGCGGPTHGPALDGSVGPGGGGEAGSGGGPGGGGSGGQAGSGGAQGGSGGTRTDGPTGAGGMPRDAAPPRDVAPPVDVPPLPPGAVIWPNEISNKNSDPWLSLHHNEIQEIHPRFLVINFANGRTLAQVMARWEAQKGAMLEGTKYHGYSDPTARSFMVMELFKLVDLTDNPIPAGFTLPNSSKMPRRNGGIDFGALFNQTYADMYAIPDPQTPAHNMTICELFNRGMVNDLFVVFNKTGTDNNVPEILEYKQMYDRNDVALPGRFDSRAGNGSWDPTDIPIINQCGRSVRLGFLEMTGVLGNSMQVNAHNYEHIGQRAVLHFNEMFRPFANFDMRTRYGTAFDDWYAECGPSAPNCISYPSENAVTYQTLGTGPPTTIDPFNQGCGNGHFPPNARQNYDQTNTTRVLSTCEHYGLHDGPDGKDLQTPYDNTTLATWRAKYGQSSTGGAWYMYWFQSWPGYNNKATMPDGTPMKNWWVYLYY